MAKTQNMWERKNRGKKQGYVMCAQIENGLVTAIFITTPQYCASEEFRKPFRFRYNLLYSIIWL